MQPVLFVHITGAAAATEALTALQLQLQQQQLVSQQQQEQLQEQQKQIRVLSIDSTCMRKFIRYDDDAATRQTNLEHKRNVVDSYKAQPAGNQEVVFDMVSGEYIPWRAVTPSHILKEIWGRFGWTQQVLDVEKDDARNALLLFRPFEWAFDNGKLYFKWDAGSGHFVIVILEKAIETKQVLDVLRYPENNKLEEFKKLANHPLVKKVFDGKTFGDYNGHPLKFPANSFLRPYKRAMCFHACKSLEQAVEKGWIKQDEVEFEEYWSEGDYVTRVEDWLATLPSLPSS
jgi:hypothetical protein